MPTHLPQCARCTTARQLVRAPGGVDAPLLRRGLRADIRLAVRPGGALRVRSVHLTHDPGPAGPPRRACGPQELRDAALGDAAYVERHGIRVSHVQ